MCILANTTNGAKFATEMPVDLMFIYHDLHLKSMTAMKPLYTTVTEKSRLYISPESNMLLAYCLNDIHLSGH
jgi:hypothetical protein